MMSTMSRIGVFAAVAVALSTAHGADAQEPPPSDLGRGERLFLAADFVGARQAFEAAVAAGLDPASEARAHAYLAGLALVLEEPDVARAHAERAVALDGRVEAPRGTPRDLAEMLREAARTLEAAAAREMMPLVAVPTDEQTWSQRDEERGPSTALVLGLVAGGLAVAALVVVLAVVLGGSSASDSASFVETRVRGWP
jgi:hypothetical protein